MKSIEEQNLIIERNEEIEDAIHISRLMDTKEYAVLYRKIEDLLKIFRFQDILGIKDDSLKDQKGIVMGIESVKNLFSEMKSLAEKPKRDPETGEEEILNKKK